MHIESEDLGENVFALQESMSPEHKWNKAIYTLEKDGHFVYTSTNETKTIDGIVPEGIGFTPKTFMHLLPNSIKKEIPKYIDSFKAQEILHPEYVVDQFIRNNWQNGKFVPRFNEDKIFLKDEKVILNKDNYGTGLSTEYIRVRYKDKTEKLYKRDEIDVEGKTVTYKEISPLGNNGEYLEISLKDINPSEDAPTQAVDNDTTESTTPESSNQDVAEEMHIEGLTSEEVKHYSKLLAEAFASPNSVSNFRARSTEDKMATKKQYKDFFTRKFKEKGIAYDESEFEKLFKTFCGE